MREPPANSDRRLSFPQLRSRLNHPSKVSQPAAKVAAGWFANGLKEVVDRQSARLEDR